MINKATVKFGHYRLEGGPDRLLRGSEEIVLRPKGLAVLAYLARRPGRLVTKEELRTQIWGTTHVTDTTLRVTLSEIRATLDAGRKGPKYLETVPGRGYRFVGRSEAGPAVEGTEIRSSESLPEGDGEPIVGRQQEIEYLLNLFLEADKGRRRVVFLGGEPGAGKTTLVQSFMERLTGRPGTTLVSSQSVMSFGEGEAYGPVLEALERLAHGSGGDALIRLLDRRAPMWLAQLPAAIETAEFERLKERTQGVTPERMVRELNELLEELTTEATLVLVLEDLHWSDRATVQLLTSIAQRPEAARLMIVGTFRPADAVMSNRALLQAIHELQGRGACEQLDVELLTRRDVGAYVAARLGGADSADVADLILQRSGGNALFMVNMFDHLREARALHKFDERWTVNRASTELKRVPEGLRPFIQQRLEMLSLEERRTLEMASVAGVEFDAAVLASGASLADLQQDLERLEPMLEDLAMQGRLLAGRGVTEWPNGILSARYRFQHDLYRESLYGEIPEARRTRLHRKIGEHLKAGFGPEAVSLAPVLAVHFESGQDAESAARYRRLAGERALGRHAYHEAAMHFKKALYAFDQARIQPAGGDPQDRLRWELEVCNVLGTALSLTRGHGVPEVGKVHSRTLSIAERLDDPTARLSALFNLWSFNSSLANLTECTNLVNRMSELAAETESDDVALMSHCAGARIALFRGKLAESADSARRVFGLYDPLRHGDLLDRMGTYEAGLSSLGADAWRLWLQGLPAQAAARSRAACELAEQVDDPFSRAYGWGWSLATLQFRGETARLGRRGGDLQRLSTERGFPLFIAWATFCEGWVAGARAEDAEGIALMERGLEAWRGTGTRILEPYMLVILSERCLRAGRIDAAGERLAEARAQVEKSGERWWEAELHRLEGEVLLAAADIGGRDGDSSDRAEACFHRALEVARRQQARSLELRAALSVSRLWSRSRRDEARRLLGGVLETFTEGHDTADLRAASEQMAELARSG